MNRFRGATLVLLCGALAGCFPVEQTITLREGKPAQMVCTFSLNEIQLTRARELGLPVSEELADDFLLARGYRLLAGGFQEEPMTGEGMGFTKFTLRCEATDRAKRSPANKLVYESAGFGSTRYKFEYDASIRALGAVEAEPFALPPQDIDRIANGDYVLKVQFPGKVLEHSGDSESVSANSTTVTWRYKLRDLLSDAPTLCEARVQIMSRSSAGLFARLALLGAFIGLVIALIQTVLQSRRAASQSDRRGKATRKRGHMAR